MVNVAISSGMRRPRSGPYITTRHAATASAAAVESGAASGPGLAVSSIFDIDSGDTRADYSFLPQGILARTDGADPAVPTC